MGTTAAARVDAWLRSGGMVVTASERAARALIADFHRARRAEGLAAWPAPAIQPWSEFVRDAWRQRTAQGCLVLNASQEESLWAEAIAAHPQGTGLLEGPRHRMARLAMEAHAFLCAYAPQLLDPRMRTGWQLDAAAFSGWLARFDEACRAGNLISAARLPLMLVQMLESASTQDGHAARPPLLLAGFDRIQHTQRQFLDAWGRWSEFSPGEDAPGLIAFFQAADLQSELAACAIWCARQLGANPQARILVITQEAATRRGEMERAFLRHAGSELLFEFTLGVPIDQVPAAHSAHLLLRWLASPLEENEVDWLFASGYAAGAAASSALQLAMRLLRHRSLEQPQWPLETLETQIRSLQFRSSSTAVAWVDRMMLARRRVAEFSRLNIDRPDATAESLHTPLECSEFASQLLELIGWPARATLSSAEFQAARRFHYAIEIAGSLGFDGRRISWQQFLSSLARVLDKTLFAPESRDAPVQIVGPAESAGMAADAIWFLGASEDAWPAAAPPHSLLPIHVQRQFGMPHATPQLDWDLARAMTARLLASAPEVCFSFARNVDDVESRPSRLVLQCAGLPQPVPEDLALPHVPAPITVEFIDAGQIPHSPGNIEGGSEVLTFESQCPFKAFAAVRLGAQNWNPAQASLTPAQRGGLLHAILHAIWGAPPPDGLRNLHDLQSLQDRQSFVAGHVRHAFRQKIGSGLRGRLPRTYLEIEEQRMVRLIGEWLDYESARRPFEVAATEIDSTPLLAGMLLHLRLDRIDRLNNGKLLVIDYKSGPVTPKSWDLPRPDDVQLPQYACFGLDRNLRGKLREQYGEKSGEAADQVEYDWLGGLVFAKIRRGDISFAGRVGDAPATLFPALAARNPRAREEFGADLIVKWRDKIEQLARDFLSGNAGVDPREYPRTCEQCGLQTLCRIHENPPQSTPSESDADLEFAEAADE